MRVWRIATCASQAARSASVTRMRAALIAGSSPPTKPIAMAISRPVITRLVVTLEGEHDLGEALPSVDTTGC